MAKFTYKAIKKEDGTPYTATVEAKDRFEVYGTVRKEGGQVVSVKEAGGSAAFIERANSFLGRVKTVEKINFMRNLGAMMEAGLTVSRALNVMSRQSKNQKLQDTIKDITNSIEQGGDLNSAMAKHPKVFSSLMISMVRAGEESGSLADSCKIIADQTERSYELKKKVRGAMLYPGIILTVLVLVGALMMIFIVPTLAGTFRDMGMELPMSTKIILLISDFLVNYYLLAIVGVIASIVGVILLLRTTQGKRVIEVFVLHIPIIGTLVKETNAARTGRTLSSLLSSGVHVIQAMEITEEVIQNTHYKAVIKKAQAVVQKGAPIAEVFIAEEKLYPPLVGELIAVGEETGNLPHMLLEIAKYYEKEVDQKTKNMSTIIEPFLMVFVGGAVGYFAVAMISPIYGMTEAF